MALTDLIEFSMSNDFTPLINDPGIAGLWFIVIMTCMNVLVQISIHAVDTQFSRLRFVLLNYF